MRPLRPDGERYDGVTKLATVKPRLGVLANRIGSIPADEQERAKQRDASNLWRQWYKTARWQKLRAKVLERDLFTCQRTGALLTGKYPSPHSAVVDHIKPHRGDPELFWDEENLHAVSKAFHDSAKQAEEQSAIKGVWY